MSTNRGSWFAKTGDTGGLCFGIVHHESESRRADSLLVGNPRFKFALSAQH